MFDGILFDLDGTIWDASTVVSQAWDRVRALHGLSRPPVTPEEVRSTMGMLLPDIAAKLFPGQPEALLRQMLTEQGPIMFEFLSKQGGVLFPRVPETLSLLSRSARLFLVSNCSRSYYAAFYTAHALKPLFTADLCPDDTGRPKGDNIAQIVREYDLRRPVYIGDTALDCRAAHQAGVPFLHAAYGFGTVDGVPQAASFDVIPAALAAMADS